MKMKEHLGEVAPVSTDGGSIALDMSSIIVATGGGSAGFSIGPKMRNVLSMRLKRLNASAITPTYGSEGAGCFDLYTTELASPVTVGEGPHLFSTGFAFEVPEGWVMLVFSRSGHGFNRSTRLSNCVGVIDSDYRGEVKVALTRDNDSNGMPMVVHTGDRIAQALLLPVMTVQFKEVDELGATDRGAAGFGSTGA